MDRWDSEACRDEEAFGGQERVDGDDAAFGGQERVDGDDVPIVEWLGGEPVPDLGRLAQERWHDVLQPLGQNARRRAVSTVRTPAEASVAMAILGGLEIDDAEARYRAERLAPPPMPAGADVPARRSGRQVNFRLGPGEHARLLEAARLFAMRPTTLARLLTVRGVERALYEARLERRDARRGAP